MHSYIICQEVKVLELLQCNLCSIFRPRQILFVDFLFSSGTTKEDVVRNEVRKVLLLEESESFDVPGIRQCFRTA